MSEIIWLALPEDHDYPAAASYLSLLMSPGDVAMAISSFKSASISTYKAKDILRAARLPTLGADNHHVAKDLKKIHNGEALSPILLVRGEVKIDAALTIADGYHRVCAIRAFDEDALIHCKLI